MEEEEVKAGAPLWMVSFGDMMTLILTFFILLVSMAEEQREGLLAKGVGSFMVALRSFGMPGVMGEAEKAQMFENVRVKFNLPPEADPERQVDYLDASSVETLRAEVVESLRPHDEVHQPAIAVFGRDSSELTPDARKYLDALATTLRPGYGELLILEGHALDAGVRHNDDNHWLAFARATAVRDYLIDEHGFEHTRIEARAWLDELEADGPGTRMVDARRVIPPRD